MLCEKGGVLFQIFFTDVEFIILDIRNNISTIRRNSFSIYSIILQKIKLKFY